MINNLLCVGGSDRTIRVQTPEWKTVRKMKSAAPVCIDNNIQNSDNK